MTEKLGVAVIGAGYWGKKLIAEYLGLSKLRNDVELRLVVDSDASRLEQVAEQTHLPRRMLGSDYSKPLADDGIQAVHIAVPNELHYAVGMAALEAKRHVLLEKPMTLNVADAVKLARKAEQESVCFQIGHIFRFNNAVKEAKRLVDAGIMGKALYYILDWEALLPPPEGRDIVFDLGPHPVDILNLLSDEWPKRVFTLGRSFLRKKPDHEEVAETIAEFPGDAFARMALSWLYRGPRRRRASIVGDSGTIEVDALNQEVNTYNQTGSTRHPVEANNTILDMITHFVNSILADEPPRANALVGTLTVAVLASMRESMSTERFVNVPPMR
jgi:predicted dehydrogenase